MMLNATPVVGRFCVRSGQVLAPQSCSGFIEGSRDLLRPTSRVARGGEMPLNYFIFRMEQKRKNRELISVVFVNLILF
jgi:hypothetical protein